MIEGQPLVAASEAAPFNYAGEASFMLESWESTSLSALGDPIEEDFLGSIFDELFPGFPSQDLDGPTHAKQHEQMGQQRSLTPFRYDDIALGSAVALAPFFTRPIDQTAPVQAPPKEADIPANSAPQEPAFRGRLEKAKLASSRSQQKRDSAAAEVKKESPPVADSKPAVPAPSTQAPSIAKMVKPLDVPVRNRRKVVLKLEQELQEKQAELEQLQEENRQLKQREKLLQMSVAVGDRSAAHASGSDFSGHLAELLQNFRGHLSKMEAQKLLKQRMAHMSPKSFSIEDMRMAVKSVVDEMGTLFLEYSSKREAGRQGEPAADPEWSEVCKPHSQRLMNFGMSICVNCPMMMTQAQSINLQTGLEQDVPLSHWETVVAKMGFSSDQLCDMVAACELFQTCYDQIKEERRQVAGELQGLITPHMDFMQLRDCMRVMEIETRLGKMQANFRKENVLQMTVAFLVLNLMTPGQMCIMSLVSWPHLPILHMLLHVIYLQHAHRYKRSSSGAVQAAAANGSGVGA